MSGRTSARWRAAALGLFAALAACAGTDPGTPSPAPGSSSFQWAGLRVGVELLAAPSDRIRARGTVTNVRGRFVEREVPRCVVMLRMYRGDRRVWSDGAGTGCFGTRIIRLGPGESHEFDRSIPARRVLGDSLPPGPYLVRAFWPGTDRPGPPRAEIEVTLGGVELRPD